MADRRVFFICGRKGAAGSGNPAKGFIFSIDATISLFVAVLLLGTSVFLSAQAQADQYGKVQVARLARDAFYSLDERGVWQTGNWSLINSTINSTFPEEIGVNVTVYIYYYENGTFNLMNETQQFGQEIPPYTGTFGIRHDAVKIENGYLANYSIMRAVVWQK